MKVALVLITYALAAGGCASSPRAQTPPATPQLTSGQPAPVSESSANKLFDPNAGAPPSSEEEGAMSGGNPDARALTDVQIHAPPAASAPRAKQGTSASELRITADVQRRVASDLSLSPAAQQVVIVTNGGTVTLRGHVASDHERASLESYAKQVSGVTRVDDQLEVTPAPNR